jgi:hypothetical protein
MASNLAWGRGGRLATAWAYAANEVRKDMKDGKPGVRSIYAIGVAGSATAFILNPAWSTKVYGSFLRQTFWFTARATAAIALPIVGVATSAQGLAVIIPVVVGAVVSDAIDEDEGLDNYTGFLTAGIIGNDPNYLTGDPNDSGYFNVVKNFKTVAETQPLTRALTWTLSETDKKVKSWEKILGF